jgi:hypothetical protein
MTAERIDAPTSTAPYFDGTQVCAQVGVEVYFHDQSWQAAAAICADCPFQAECAQYALDRPWILGVWGGTTKAHRDRIRRRTKAGKNLPPEWYSMVPGHRPGPKANGG